MCFKIHWPSEAAATHTGRISRTHTRCTMCWTSQVTITYTRRSLRTHTFYNRYSHVWLFCITELNVLGLMAQDAQKSQIKRTCMTNHIFDLRHPIVGYETKHTHDCQSIFNFEKHRTCVSITISTSRRRSPYSLVLFSNAPAENDRGIAWIQSCRNKKLQALLHPIHPFNDVCAAYNIFICR